MILDLDLTEVKMAIFWKMLNELDIYTTGKVKTFSGDSVSTLLESLRSSQIQVEVMD